MDETKLYNDRGPWAVGGGLLLGLGAGFFYLRADPLAFVGCLLGGLGLGLIIAALVPPRR